MPRPKTKPSLKPTKPSQAARRKRRRSSKGRLIVKLGYHFVPKGEGCIPIPMIAVLADSAAFKQMANLFLRWHRRALKYESGALPPDPRNDLGINCNWPPFDQDSTDQLEFRIGAIDARCEAEFLGRHGATPAEAQRGALMPRYAKAAKEAERMMRLHNRILLSLPSSNERSRP